MDEPTREKVQELADKVQLIARCLGHSKVIEFDEFFSDSDVGCAAWDQWIEEYNHVPTDAKTAIKNLGRMADEIREAEELAKSIGEEATEVQIPLRIIREEIKPACEAAQSALDIENNQQDDIAARLARIAIEKANILSGDRLKELAAGLHVLAKNEAQKLVPGEPPGKGPESGKGTNGNDEQVAWSRRLVDGLSAQQVSLLKFLEERKHPTKWKTVANIGSCFRVDAPSDETIYKALQRLHFRLHKLTSGKARLNILRKPKKTVQFVREN